MKKITVLICVILMALTLNAQEKIMNVNLKTGTITEIPISTIDSITFKVQQKKMNVHIKAGGVTEISHTTIEDITFKAGTAGVVLTTSNATNVTVTGATLGGNITNAGTPAYTERGVCWSTSQNPTVSNNKKVVSGTGTGSFSTDVSGLTANTTYYVRAYAINSTGTAYGNQISFTTLQEPGTLPVLTTANASNVTATGATLGGNITNAGTPAYTERGVCWSTSQNPTVSSNKKVVSGTGTGSFSTDVSGLSASTTYYVRAYAINSTGTAYGNQISFTTPTNLTAPVLTGPASNTTGVFTLTWTFNWPSQTSSDDHYELEASYYPTSGFEVLVVYPNGDRKSPYTDLIYLEAVDIGKTLYFRVRAKANGSYSPYSNVHAVSVPYVNVTYWPNYQNNVTKDYLTSTAQYLVLKNQATMTVGYSYFKGDTGPVTFNDWAVAMYWDIDGLIQGRTIQKAVLKLYVNNYAPNTNGNYTVYPLAGGWNNNTLCYANLPNIYTSPSATKPITVSPAYIWEVDITNIVSAWANGSKNFGILVRDPDISNPVWNTIINRKTTFHGVSAATEAWRPTLYLEIK